MNLLEKTFPTINKTNFHKDILLFMSFGLGCSSNENNDQIKLQLSVITQINKDDIFILCNDKSPLKNISKMLFRFNYLSTNDYVNRYKESILENIKYCNKILIFGHSFGGAIVNRVAEELNKITGRNDDLKKIFMATFGSIYIPADNGLYSQSKINIINYLALGDISFKFAIKKLDNEFNEEYYRYSYNAIPEENGYTNNYVCHFKNVKNTGGKIIAIEFLDQSGYLIRPKFILSRFLFDLNILKMFEIHNSYSLIIADLLHTRTNDIKNSGQYYLCYKRPENLYTTGVFNEIPNFSNQNFYPNTSLFYQTKIKKLPQKPLNSEYSTNNIAKLIKNAKSAKNKEPKINNHPKANPLNSTLHNLPLDFYI
jgi:hypothetical protein